jgi:hypothetical protein
MVDLVGGVAGDFKEAAFAGAEKEPVLIDKDLVAWFRTQGDLTRQVNDLGRFYMDTCVTRELEFDMDAFEASQGLNGPEHQAVKCCMTAATPAPRKLIFSASP